MAITSRALAFASRWFDEATVRRVFEPLIADWQREWLDATVERRRSITLRASLAFICAVVVSSPRILLTRTPRAVSDGIASRMVKFMAVATVLLMIPPVTELWTWRGASWMRASLFLYSVPAAITLAFPFAMTGAVDALRRQTLPGHVERATLLKLGALAAIFMLVYSGWVVPASGEAARNAMNPAGMGEPLRLVRDLTTFELVFDPARASVFEPGTISAARSRELAEQLNRRAAFVALPIVLLWLRWSALSRPRKRWLAPLHDLAATAFAMVTVFGFANLGSHLQREWQVWPGTNSWLPIAVLALVGCLSPYVRRFLPDATKGTLGTQAP